MKKEARISDTKIVSRVADGIELEFVRVTATYEKLFKITWYTTLEESPRVGDYVVVDIHRP